MRSSALRCCFRLTALACVLAAFDGAVAAGEQDALREAVAASRLSTPANWLPRSTFSQITPDPIVALSPNSEHVAYLLGEPGKRSLWLMHTAQSQAKRLLPQTDANTLLWSQDSRWMFLQSPTSLAAVALGGKGSRVVARLNDHLRSEVLGRDPSRPDAVIVLEQSLPYAPKPVSRVLRITAEATVEVLLEENRPIADALIAPNGGLAAWKVIEKDRQRVMHKSATDAPSTLVECVELQRCGLISTGADGASVWLNANFERDLAGLQRLAPDGALSQAFEDPAGIADLDHVVLDPVTQQPLFASLRSPHPQLHGLTGTARRQLETLNRRLPQRDLAIQPGHGDQASWLISERNSNMTMARWHLFAPATGELREILSDVSDERVAPIDAQFAHKQPISWRASDGMRLHGFLSLPAGRDPALTPLLVSVHGVPWSASTPGYSAFTQFFVNRGYAVFEPNFRGSTGYGRAYTLSANGDFGNGRVQLDIVEGTRHLLANGVGDAHRVAIIGGSFGGYSALLGATFQPELFRLAIAALPPSDFAWTLRWAASDSDLAVSDGIPLTTRFRLLGVDIDDATIQARLHAQSPLANANRLTRPVLLFAGGQDERVAIRSVTHYAAVLRQLQKDVTLFIEPEIGHGSDDPLIREAYLYLAESMLHKHLAGAEPEAPSAALTDYLKRNLR